MEILDISRALDQLDVKYGKSLSNLMGRGDIMAYVSTLGMILDLFESEIFQGDHLDKPESFYRYLKELDITKKEKLLMLFNKIENRFWGLNHHLKRFGYTQESQRLIDVFNGLKPSMDTILQEYRKVTKPGGKGHHVRDRGRSPGVRTEETTLSDEEINKKNKEYISKHTAIPNREKNGSSKLGKVKVGLSYKCEKKFKDRFVKGNWYEVLGINDDEKVLVRDEQNKRIRIPGTTFAGIFDIYKGVDKSKSDEDEDDNPDVTLGNLYQCKKELKKKYKGGEYVALRNGEYYQVIDKSGKKIMIKFYREEVLKNPVSKEKFINKKPVRLSFVHRNNFDDYFNVHKTKKPDEPFVEKKPDDTKPKLSVDKYYKCVKNHTKKKLKSGRHYLVKRLYKGKTSGSWHVVFYDGNTKLDFHFTRFDEFFDTEKPISSLTGPPGEDSGGLVEEPESQEEKTDDGGVGFVTKKIKKGE